MMIIKTILLFVILILSAYYDFKKRIVPDFLTYPGIILGLTFIFILKKSFWWYYLSAGIGGFISLDVAMNMPPVLSEFVSFI